jgi:5-methylcytosine-specific restriction protein A
MGELSNRSKGAIELKYQNISAILHEEGLGFIEGYKPRGNYQRALREHVLSYVQSSGLDLGNLSEKSKKEDSFSWTILPNTEAIKRIDKSAILYHGTGVPKQVLPFFGIDETNPPQSLHAVHRNKEYVLRVDVRARPSLRVRLYWPKKLSENIAREYPNETAMLKADDEQAKGALIMHFRKLTDASFEIEYYAAGELKAEPIPEEYSPQIEGEQVKVEYFRRVRSAINRRKAIEHHGTTCAICGFDFEKAYGELGKGFIEIHHLTPLGSTETPKEVDPTTDLIPLCANCHRMIHRGAEGVMNPDELRAVVNYEKSGEQR